MRDEEIAAVRGELEAFVAGVFASLPRKDQRAKGGLYVGSACQSVQTGS